MNTLPSSLAHFESQLEQAITRQRDRGLRTVGVRTALAGVAAAAIALGLLSAGPGTGPSVVERAAAALTSSDGAVLHVVAVSSDGGGVTSRIELWQQMRPPYDQRRVVGEGNRRYELATVDGSTRLYDPSTNTITSAPRVGTPTKSLPSGKAGASKPIGGPVENGADPFRGKILALLKSGKAREAGRVRFDGRPLVRIVSTATDMELLVDAQSYEPVEWRFIKNGARMTTRFLTYEHLGTDSLASLSLTAQHPEARIDNDPAAYLAAQERLGLSARR